MTIRLLNPTELSSTNFENVAMDLFSIKIFDLRFEFSKKKKKKIWANVKENIYISLNSIILHESSFVV
jgi:hypothetical protein